MFQESKQSMPKMWCICQSPHQSLFVKGYTWVQNLNNDQYLNIDICNKNYISYKYHIQFLSMEEYDPNRFTYTKNQQPIQREDVDRFTQKVVQNTNKPNYSNIYATNDRQPSFPQQSAIRNTFSKNQPSKIQNEQVGPYFGNTDPRISTGSVHPIVRQSNAFLEQISKPSLQGTINRDSRFGNVVRQQEVVNSSQPQIVRSSIPANSFVQRQTQPQILSTFSKIIPEERSGIPQQRIKTYLPEGPKYVPPSVNVTRIIKDDAKVETVNDEHFSDYYRKPVLSAPPPVEAAAPSKTCCTPLMLILLGLLGLAGLITCIILASSYSAKPEVGQSVKIVPGDIYSQEYTVIKQQTILTTGQLPQATSGESQLVINKPQKELTPSTVEPTIQNVNLVNSQTNVVKNNSNESINNLANPLLTAHRHIHRIRTI